MTQCSLFKKVVEEFKKMPGIGQKSAERLTLYILSLSEEEADMLASLISDVRRKKKYCKVCNNLCEEDICPVCADIRRDTSVICVVEQPMDVIAIEKSKAYNGLYHVLWGKLSPLDGIGSSGIKANGILDRINNSSTKEIIIATSSDTGGQTTALYICHILKGKNIRISRIAQGLPVGTSLEYVDQPTIACALKGRIQIDRCTG